MKTELTREQSQHLIDLGVPKEKASEYESEGSGFWATTNYYPIFKLEDFLNGEILPKEIPSGYIYKLTITCDDNKYKVGYKSETTRHLGISINEVWAEELIDALYRLTCWYYEDFLK